MSAVTKTNAPKASPKPPAKLSTPAPAAKPAASSSSSAPKDEVRLSKESKDSSDRGTEIGDALKANFTDSKTESKTKASEDRAQGTDRADDPRAAMVAPERLESIQNLEDRRRAIQSGQAPEVREQHERIDAETDSKVQEIRARRDEQLEDPKARLEKIETQYQVDVATAKANGAQRAREAAEKIAEKPEGHQSLADMDSLYEIEKSLKSDNFEGNREEAQAKAQQLRDQLKERGINYPTDEQLQQQQDKWNRYHDQNRREGPRSTARKPWASPELSYIHERRLAEGSKPEFQDQALARAEEARDRSTAIENGVIDRFNRRAAEQEQGVTRTGNAQKRKVTREALHEVNQDLKAARRVPTAELPDHLRESEAVKRAPKGTEFSLTESGDLVGIRFGREVSRAKTDGQSVEMTSKNIDSPLSKTETILSRTAKGWDEDSESTGYNADFESYSREGSEEWRHSRAGDTILESYRKDGRELGRTQVREKYGKEVYRQEFDVEDDGREVTTTSEKPDFGTENHKVDTKYPDGTRLIEEKNRFRNTTTEATTVEKDGHSYRSETVTREDGNRGGSSRTRRYQDGELQEESVEIRTKQYGNPHQMVPDTLFKNSPQDMLERLGPTGEITTERVIQRGSDGDRSFTRFTNKDGSKQMSYTENRSGMSVVEYSEKTENGSQSQTFFQGTKDTVISRTENDGKWQTTTTEERYDELSKHNKDLPERQKTVSRSTDEGTASDLARTLTGGLSGVAKTDAWKAFQSSTGAGDLKLVTSQVENEAGQSSQVIAEAPDGRRFITVEMPDGQVFARTESPDGSRVDSVLGADGKFHSRSRSAEEAAYNPVSDRDGLQSGDDFAKNGKRAADGAAKATSMKGFRSRAARTTRQTGSTVLRGLDTAFDSASLVLNGIGMAADLENFDKDPMPVLRRGAEMGMDVASLVDDLGKTKLASRLASGSRGLASAGRLAGSAAKVLGKFSSAAGLVFAGMDVADGNYVEAGLGAVSSVAFMLGPVGWGVGALAFAGSLVWEADKADQIAAAAF